MGAVAAVFGSATGESRALRAYDAAVRAPLPVCRRIGFVQLAPTVGGSTTAAAVATVLARRRTGMVLAVDASPSPRGLLPLLGAPATRSGPRPGAGTPAGTPAGTAAEARAGLGRAPSGCFALDLRPAPVGAWTATVGPIGRFFDVVVTDWGLRHPGYDLEPVLGGSHAVCLVVRAEDVAGAAALLHSLRARPGTPPVVVALTGRTRRFPGSAAGFGPAVGVGPAAGVGPAVAVGPGPRQHLRLAAELMRPTGGDRRDR